MISMPIMILSFLLAITILVAVHEFGHFWVARRFGVKVLRFSIGFGKPLLRWRRNGENVSPGQFMPTLESHPRLMMRTGRWILRQALHDLQRLQEALQRPFGFSINLSGEQMEDPQLETLAHELIASLQLDPSHITLELTESSLVTDLDKARDFMNRCHEMGMQIAIDDFGTGYASLAYLQHFPADKIKLDKAFVDPIDPTDRATLAIPEATIAMAHALNASLVAEGVETEMQLDTLASLGADLIQGYYYSRPLPFDELLDYLKRENAAP